MKRRSVVLLVVLSTCFGLGAQESLNQKAEAVFRFSNISGRVITIKSEMRSRINSYFGSRDTSIRDKIAEICDDLLDEGRITSAIVEALKKSCSEEILDEYIDVHHSDFYKRISIVEERPIAEAENDAYRSDDETDIRKKSLTAIVETFGINYQNYLYNRAMYGSFYRVLNTMYEVSPDDGIPRLYEDLYGFFMSPEQVAGTLRWMGVVYRPLDDETLSAYVEYITSEQTLLIYRALYEGFQEGVEDCFAQYPIPKDSDA